MLHIYYCCWRVVTRSGICFEDWTFIFLNVHSIVYIIHVQSSNFRLSYTVDISMFEILSVNPITNVTIRRSLFQWSEKKCIILLPCQNSLSPTHTQPFIPTISTNIPTLFFAHLTNRSDNWVNHVIFMSIISTNKYYFVCTSIVSLIETIDFLPFTDISSVNDYLLFISIYTV